MNLRSLVIFWTFLFTSNFAIAESANKSVRIAFSDLPKLIREKNEKVQAAETAASAAKLRTGFLTRSFLPGLALKTGSESAQFGSGSSARRRAGAGVSTNADAVQLELENTLLSQQLKKLTLEKDLLQNKLSVAIEKN